MSASPNDRSTDGMMSRRLLLSSTAAAATGLPGLASAIAHARPAHLTESEKKMEDLVKLVKVPGEEDIAKALKTAPKGISEATHRAHLVLWQGYANKTNEIRKALAELDTDPAKANQIYSPMRALKVNYAFAYGGLINHNVYFDTIGGEGGPATGDVAGLINEAYGSFERWAADWKATGIAGRGWVYLGYDHDEQRVHTYIGDAQDTFPCWNNTLLLAMDVYEHAYYLDFQQRRPAYIDAWFNCVDWEAVNRRLILRK
jgi:Fe-Mn family superoxide dismutase